MADVDRVDAGDRAYLAMDRRMPSHVAAVLILDALSDPASATATLHPRVAAIPRLRQRIVRAPLGCGGPFWVDDSEFHLDRHVHRMTCPPPGDDRALLDAAAAIAGRRLPRDRPLWSITFLTGLTDGRTAMVVVLHHAVADGIGGLAVLAALADDAPQLAGDRGFPRPFPSRARLATDAAARRLRAIPRAPRAARDLWRAMTAAGGLRPEPPARCSTHCTSTGAPRLTRLLRSRGAWAAYRLEDMADDAVAVLDHLGWPTAHIVGASLGGMVAQTVAIRHPHRVRSLTSMMSTPVTPDRPSATRRDGRARRQAAPQPGRGRTAARPRLSGHRFAGLSARRSLVA